MAPDNVTQNGQSPYTAQGRAFGKSAAEQRDLGMDAFGHPTSSGPWQGAPGQQMGQYSRPSGTRSQGIAQLAQSIGSMDLANQDDLHAFCEAVRHVLNYIAVSVVLAGGQLKASARAQARQTKEGMLNPVDAAKLAVALKLVGKDLHGTAEACTSGAAGAVKAWRRFETLLTDLENGNGHGFRRPGGGSKGFTLVQG